MTHIAQMNRLHQIKIFTLILGYIFLFASCQTSNNLQQSKEALENHIQEAEGLLNSNGIEIKPSTVGTKELFDENNDRNFTSDQTKYLSVNQFVSFVQKEHHIDVKVIKPSNLVKLHISYLDLTNSLGLKIEDGNSMPGEPNFIPTMLHFWDGSTSAVNGNYKTLDTTKIATESEELLGFNEFLIPSDKPIKAVDFDVKFKHKGFTGYRLDSIKTKANVDGGIIEWKGNQNGEVSLSYPQAIDERIGETYGFYKNGKMLQRSGRTSYSIPSAEMKEWLKKTLPAYQKAIDLIDNKELKTKQEVDAYLTKNLSKKPIQTNEKTFSKTFYSGPVDYVMVYVENTKPENVIKKISMKLHKDYPISHNKGYFAAMDAKTNKYGIIDINGSWIINPTYDEIRGSSEGTFDVYENKIGTVRKLDVINKKFINLRD